MRRTLLLLGAALALALIGLGYIGYLGGAVIALVPARGAPLPADRGLAVVLLSGDMGPHVGMGRSITSRLSRDGVPVVTVNSLAFFRQRRTPAEAGRLIVAALDRAAAIPGVRRLALVGQSFGADMAHVGLATLRPGARARIERIALVVPGDTVDYRASPSEIFDLAAPDAPALPTARRLGRAPLLCVYGAEETDSLCPHLRLPRQRTVALPGGHPLHHDDEVLYLVVKDFLDRPLERAP